MKVTIEDRKCENDVIPFDELENGNNHNEQTENADSLN